MTQRFRRASREIMLALCLLCSLSPVLCRAQADKPLFWTSGGNWGPWTKDPAHPGISSRAACGDDSTMKNLPVSSEDWQTRNGYAVPIGIVFRMQFFDKQTNRNAWTGWMQQDLQPGEVTDGWTVVSGHCADHLNRKGLTIQTRCVVRAGEESDKCYKDESGNAYPTRPADAFRGSHDPGTQKPGAGQKVHHWFCDVTVVNPPNVWQEEFQHEFLAFLHNGGQFSGCFVYNSRVEAENGFNEFRTNEINNYPPNIKTALEPTVDWAPK